MSAAWGFIFGIWFNVCHLFSNFQKPGLNAFTVVPDSQLVVTRAAYKSYSSKYAINGRPSSYSEVHPSSYNDFHTALKR
jgi:chromosome segregation ATPase